jgi:cytochrome d ubiquinol oxidase subunit I
VVVLGDESGYLTTEHQKMKLASIEAEWHTQAPPASFTVFGIPDRQGRETKYAVKIPWLLGLIATRSIDKPVEGIDNLVMRARTRISDGILAYKALQILKQDPGDEQARSTFEAHKANLGYALLLKTIGVDPARAGPDDIARAANATVPPVGVMFWSFRVMVGLGFLFIIMFAFAFYVSATQRFQRYRWFLRFALLALPLPWIAAELGWVVAEVGRQPWVIYGVLPTQLAASSITGGQVLGSIIGFVLFYSALAVVDVFLMVRYARMGPEAALDKKVIAPEERLAAKAGEV